MWGTYYGYSQLIILKRKETNNLSNTKSVSSTEKTN